jgi:glutamine cyclotransferase
VGFVYSLPDLKIIKDFKYDTTTGEGWGITFIEHTNEFYVSDGSEFLMVWNAETLEEKRRIAVIFDTGSHNVTVNLVNELEFIDFASDHSCVSEMLENKRSSYVNGGSGTIECSNSAQTSVFTSSMRILANIWYQDILISIDPTSGLVKKVYNLNDIYPIGERHKDGADCLNGITVTGEQSSIGDGGSQVWVTGKWWPKMYRIQLID